MPADETIRLKEQLHDQHNKEQFFFHPKNPVYNIDDMDDANYMMDHRMEGVYCISSPHSLNPAYPGKVFVDGNYSGKAIISPNAFTGGTLIGLPVRKRILEYGKTYQIRFEGAQTKSGTDIPPYEFFLTSLTKVAPGTIYPEHDHLVLQAARECMVLLRNKNHTLPLQKGTILNVFGKGGPAFRLGCVGAGKINPRYGIRFEEGIRTYSSLELNEELFSYYRETEDNSLPPEALLNHAQAQSNTAVVLLTRGTGEAMDNHPTPGEYYLSDEERELLFHVSTRFTHTVVILNTGYPIEMNWIKDYAIDSILWCSLPGMAGGRALAEILDGTVNPSGRLPDTWTFDYLDHPSAHNFYVMPDTSFASPLEETSFVNTVYEEDLYVGYRYFTSFGKKVAFPFGHGLHYTNFTTECVHFDASGAHVSCDMCITNTGAMAGKESILLYAKIPSGSLEQPLLRLVSFAKTDTIAPGSSQYLHFDIEPWQLHSYQEKSACWIIEAGTIELFFGGSVEEAYSFANFTITDTIVTSQVKNRVTPPISISTLTQTDPKGSFPRGTLSGYVNTPSLPYPRARVATAENRPLSKNLHEKESKLITYPMLIQHKELLEDFVLQMSTYELCRMSVGGRTGWGPDDNGFAGCIYNEGKLSKYQLPNYYMTDGNNGLNLHIATIGFPVSNAICATFNETLSYEEGRALAREAQDMNLQCILAPAMNLHRNPLCGRHAEYFSEDPYLAGRMGGMESRGIESMGIASVMKHLFANNAENYRNRNHSIMTERAARELYLKVFEVALHVHMPNAFMTGYNPANGCWCAGDEELLEGILREEWGFRGYVMTDWGSSNCCPPVPTAQAGNSWIAPGCMDDSEVLPLLEGLENGDLDIQRLRSNVRDMVRVLIQYAQPK